MVNKSGFNEMDVNIKPINLPYDSLIQLIELLKVNTFDFIPYMFLQLYCL